MITVVTVSNVDKALLIILSVFLALFLLLSIIALVWIINILKDVKRIITKAEAIADEANDGINKFFAKTTPVLALVNIVSNLFGGSKHNNHKDK